MVLVAPVLPRSPRIGLRVWSRSAGVRHPSQHDEEVTMEEAISVDFVTPSSPGQSKAGLVAQSGAGCVAGRASNSNSDEMHTTLRSQAHQSPRGRCSCNWSSSSRMVSAIDSRSAYSPVIHGVKGFADSLSDEGHLWAQRKQRHHRGSSSRNSRLRGIQRNPPWQQLQWDRSRWGSSRGLPAARAGHSLWHTSGDEM